MFILTDSTLELMLRKRIRFHLDISPLIFAITGATLTWNNCDISFDKISPRYFIETDSQLRQKLLLINPGGL